MLRILSEIVAIAQAIPKIKELIDMFYDLWVKQKIINIENESDLHDKKRAAIINSISRAQSNEERRVLSVMLADIDRVSNSDS